MWYYWNPKKNQRKNLVESEKKTLGNIEKLP